MAARAGTADPAAEAAVPGLEVRGLEKRFGALVVLSGLDLVLQPGERRVLIGPNGAGKTTFFNLATGLLTPDRGAIRIGGADVTRLPVHRRVAHGLARTFQISTLFPRLSVRHSLLLALMGTRSIKFSLFRPLVADSGLQRRADALLEEWDMADRAEVPIQSLSYGDQRQVEILLAIAQSPKLLLLDEPTAGLSPAETQSIVEVIRGLPSSLTMLVIEHDMDVAFELAQTFSVLYQGRLIVTGDRETIRSDARVQQIYLGDLATAGLEGRSPTAGGPAASEGKALG